MMAAGGIVAVASVLSLPSEAAAGATSAVAMPLTASVDEHQDDASTPLWGETDASLLLAATAGGLVVSGSLVIVALCRRALRKATRAQEEEADPVAPRPDADEGVG